MTTMITFRMQERQRQAALRDQIRALALVPGATVRGIGTFTDTAPQIVGQILSRAGIRLAIPPRGCVQCGGRTLCASDLRCRACRLQHEAACTREHAQPDVNVRATCLACDVTTKRRTALCATCTDELCVIGCAMPGTTVARASEGGIVITTSHGTFRTIGAALNAVEAQRHLAAIHRARSGERNTQTYVP